VSFLSEVFSVPGLENPRYLGYEILKHRKNIVMRRAMNGKTTNLKAERQTDTLWVVRRALIATRNRDSVLAHSRFVSKFLATDAHNIIHAYNKCEIE